MHGVPRPVSEREPEARHRAGPVMAGTPDIRTRIRSSAKRESQVVERISSPEIIRFGDMVPGLAQAC